MTIRKIGDKPRPKVWNTRYLEYARMHGYGPEEMHKFDLERYPGGVMHGFTKWVQDRWREWAIETGHPKARDTHAPLTSQDHVAFDAWLTTVEVGHGVDG